MNEALSSAAMSGPVRILLLEDSDLDAELVGELIARAGLPHTVTRAMSRDEFLAEINPPRHDLILADYVLPSFDGLSALALAREHCPEVPFVFVSGTLGEDLAVEALKHGATDYVTKHRLDRLPLAIVRALKEAKASVERHRAERALHELNTTLEARVAERTRERDRIWQVSQDLLAVAGTDGYLKAVNPAWTQLLGHDAATLLATPFAEFIHPEDLGAAGDIMSSLARGEVTQRFEDRLRCIDGSYRWISWTAVPEGEVFYAVGRDVTVEKGRTEEIAAAHRELVAQTEERERVEATLRQMQRLEAVGQLTSGVAHDFNNLLTVVLGNIGFLKRSAAEPSQKRRLEMMRSAAERGATLTAQLLAFSRRQRLDPKPILINEIVAGMGDLLRSSIGGTVRLETVLKPTLWPALVDPTQLELVILNLAINARDAMAVGGSLTIETSNTTVRETPSRSEEPAPGQYVVVCVSDTGTGMSDEVLEKAFEPFFTTKEVGKGSGLGLAQVFGFAKQSGGGVRIVTRPGEGTTVKVYLPRAAGEVLSNQPSAPVASGSSRGELVLVVDDDSAVREVTSALLQDLGYAVAEAGSGSAALDLLEGEISPDLLLVDFAMPGMNGAEVARQVRSKQPGLPILFVTGYADTAAIASVGEGNVILKPFRQDELGRCVRQALSGRGDQPGNVVPLRAGKR